MTSLRMALTFLDIPKQKWKDIIEDSVLASVRALAYTQDMILWR